MKKRSIMAMFLSAAVCVSTLAIGITAEESTLILPTSLWTQTTQNANCTSVTQKADGVQISIKAPGAGENNYVDWAGDSDGAGPGYVDFSKPVDFCFTIDSLDMGSATYGPWGNIWTGFILFGNGATMSLNVASTAAVLGDPGVHIYVGTDVPAAPSFNPQVSFAGTTYFWHLDLVNAIIEVGTSSSPDVFPTNMTNILVRQAEDIDKIPTNVDDLMSNYYGRHNITLPTEEMKFTMHSFQGTSMIPATVVAKAGQGATIVDSQITFDANNSDLTVANLLEALTIEGGTVKVFDGAAEIGDSVALKAGLTIEVKNGAIVNLYTVTVSNMPIVATPTPTPSTTITLAPTSSANENPQTDDTNTNPVAIILLIAISVSVLTLNKKRLLSK